MIRVAHVVTAYSSAVTILAHKLAALDRYPDLNVTVITSPRPTGMHLPDPPVRHLTIPMLRSINPPTDLRSTRLLSRTLARERFDVVHSHTSKAGIIATLAARYARVPLIVHTHHGLPYYEGQSFARYHTYRLIEVVACRFRHHLFSQNRRDLAACVALMGDAEKVSYEGNGVDPEFVRKAADGELARAESDFPGPGLRVALVSRLEPVKRVAAFLEVCSLLQRRGLDVTAVIAGDGPLRPALEEEIAASGLRERVRLLGWAPHAPSLLAACDVAVLTSEKEGIPRALIEAMALGKPIVATDVPGTQELVVDGETGFLTPLGNVAAMADKIADLATDTDLRHRLGQAGQDRVQEHFNDLKIAEFLHDFYVREHERRRGRA